MDHHGATGPSLPARWWGPATTIASADVMNQLCRVCGEPAAGFHFGAFTCEGCKSFFGRTYNNLSSVSECKNNGECIINKKNRTSCKACRLRKCLLVGMSKSGSRYGRRSNWFKIHCLLQEQQLQQQQHQQGGGGIGHTTVPQTDLGFPSKKSSWERSSGGGGSGKTSSTPSDHLDNNNNSSSGGPLPETIFEPPPPFSAEDSPWIRANAAAAALTVPHPHHPHHALPYFISPFLQNPLHPVSQNYLLPFLPIRPPLPLEPLIISSSPPSSVRSSPGSTTVTTPKKEISSSEDTVNSLEKLRALGPVQDQPIDLSSANNTVKEKEIFAKEKYGRDGDATGIRSCSLFQFEEVEKRDLGQMNSKTTVPLDLSCTKS